MGVGAFARECSASVAYRALAQRLGITEFVFLPGRVGPDEASDYYALLDLVVIPRRPFAVCEMVSPVKPLEAVARGKRVLMSNVAPLADLAELSPNFNYFKDRWIRWRKSWSRSCSPLLVLRHCQSVALWRC